MIARHSIDHTYRPTAPIPTKGEVEVARICYPDTAASDVVKVLAKREGKRIFYRVATDNGDVLATLRSAALPLTTGQLIRLIHTAKQAGAYWTYLQGCGIDRDDLPAFQAFSDHYPGLRSYYAAQHRARRQRDLRN